MSLDSVTRELDRLVRLSQQRPDLVGRAVRRILDEDKDLLWAFVVSMYLDREVNLGKAAELLGLHEIELRERFIALGIPLRIGPADIDDAHAEVQAVRNWFSPPR